MQAFIMRQRRDEFEQELNELLLDGWRIVPGTFSVQSVQRAANQNTPPHFVTVGGITFDRVWFVAVERADV